MHRARGALLSALLLFTPVAACGDEPAAALRAAIAEGCSLNSDCSSPLVCAFQTCHVECKSTRDCEKFGGGLCVESDKPYYVCQNPSEKNCTRNRDCPGKQVCGTDLKCRDDCVSDRDCLTGQKCTGAVRADPIDLIDGVLPSATNDTVGGTQCVHHSDCPGALVCLAQICTVECVTDKDCKAGRSCQGTRCLPPGAGLGGSGGAAGSGGAPAIDRLHHECAGAGLGVAVIPVRETEAWAIVDGDALRRVFGATLTDEALGLPSSAGVAEGTSDPKALLNTAFNATYPSGLRRTRGVSPMLNALGEQVSLLRLRELAAFSLLEHELRQALRQLSIVK